MFKQKVLLSVFEKRLLKNKKAGASGEFLLWLFRIIMIIFVVAGIMAMTSILYSKQFDVRQVEASQINEKLFSCSLFDSFTEADLRRCIGIDEKENYVNLTIVQEKSKKSISIGDASMEESCKIIEKFKYKPYCQESIYYVLFNNERATLKVLVGIKKVEKNAL